MVGKDRPLARFAAGVASAFVLLNTAAWAMVRLTVLGRPAMGGLIFCGPGVGIALTGLATSLMVQAQWRAASGWVVFGLLSILLALYMLKSALGIDVFKNFHVGIWTWFVSLHDHMTK